MKRNILITVLAAVLALSFASPLAAGKKKRPHPGTLKYPPLEIKTPDVIDLQFDNDLEGFLIEDHEVPVVDIVLLVKTYYPAAEKVGLNGMAGWVIRNGGTETWPSDKLNDELEFLAASVEVNAGGLATYITMDCLKKDLDRVLGIFADLVMNPSFPDDKIEMRRKTMLEEIRRKNDQPRAVSRREFFKLIYEGHPFGRESTVPTVNAIMRDDLVAFHGNYFHPNNAIIGISGDVTKDEIVTKLNEVFNGWEQVAVQMPAVPEINKDPAPSWNYAYKDISQAYIMLGHLGINSENPDRCAINIMNFILGGGSFTSWITEEVRNNAGLAYSTGSRYGSNAFARGSFYAYAQTKAEEYHRALQMILDLVDKMREEGPTEEEVQKAIDSYLNSHVFDYESKSQVVRRLVQLKFEGRPLDTPERDIEEYEKLTLEDINRVAKQYLNPDRFVVFVLGDAEQFGMPLEEFGAVNVIELKEE
jgi:predicted Zn-dependent peptidase